jgi:hypothetical protein
MIDASSAKFGTKRAGNSPPPIPAPAPKGGGAFPSAGAANFSASPNETKWFFHATILPLASTAPVKLWNPAAR